MTDYSWVRWIAHEPNKANFGTVLEYYISDQPFKKGSNGTWYRSPGASSEFASERTIRVLYGGPLPSPGEQLAITDAGTASSLPPHAHGGPASVDATGVALAIAEIRLAIRAIGKLDERMGDPAPAEMVRLSADIENHLGCALSALKAGDE